MSPRRKFRPDEGSLLAVPTTTSPTTTSRRRWETPLVAMVAAVVAVAAITVSTLMLISHESHRRTEQKDREVLSYVTWFMTGFTTIDPYKANDYVDRILAQATGEFAKHFQETANETLLTIARAERTTGTVKSAGLERWNEDGTATVLVATDVTSKSPDEKQVFHNINRWTATAKQEGNQWKISNLLQVI
jgi:Mce-associated membrane protein